MRKDLYEVVIDALELFAKAELPNLRLGSPKKRLVVASGNALPTGRIIFKDEDAVFASEDDYQNALKKSKIDGAVVISASGGKHAPIIVGDLLKHEIDTYLLTCNGKSPAAQLLPSDRVFETPCNEEPITYNTSTYLGMILAKTKESSKKILEFIREEVDPTIPDMSKFKAFYLILEGRFNIEREMFVTKFDELFGPMMPGRCYTLEQTLHAKTVVKSEKELFLSFGYKNEVFGHENARLNIPLFDGADHAAMIAIGYYVIGKIQSQLPPWFHDSSDRYKALQPELFRKVLGV
jgi:hypothetical protein